MSRVSIFSASFLIAAIILTIYHHEKLEILFHRNVQGIPIGEGQDSVDNCMASFFEASFNENMEAFSQIGYWNHGPSAQKEMFVKQGDEAALREAFLLYEKFWGNMSLEEYKLAWDENIYCSGASQLLQLGTFFAFLHGEIIWENEKTAHWTFPTLVTNGNWEVIGYSTKNTTQIELVKKDGRWYVKNYSCASYGSIVDEYVDLEKDLHQFPRPFNAKDHDVFPHFWSLTTSDFKPK